MNTIDNIISRINDETKRKVDDIVNTSNAEIKKINDDAKQKVEDEISIIRKRQENELKNIKERSKTSADIKKQKAELSMKNDVIFDTINKAKEKILNLPLNDYVDLLKKLYDNNKPTSDATIKFSKKDLERLPKELFSYMEKNTETCKVSISNEPANINGGFIIDFGNIVWNLSVDSLIDQNIDNIIDLTNNILFG